MAITLAPYDFETARHEWQRVPVDDLGYHDTRELLRLPDAVLGTLVVLAGAFRYRTDPPLGWRNLRNSWRTFFGLDTTHGKLVLDFGCGFGLEALQFARTGNQVALADLAPENVQCATRVLHLFGCTPVWTTTVLGMAPFFWTPEPIDIFYANGVLHHTPQIREILASAMTQLTPDGEARILLYSDRLWLDQVGSPLPAIDADVQEHPNFARFVANDAVGTYADWYSPDKLRRRLEGVCQVSACEYIGDGRLLGAILRPHR